MRKMWKIAGIALIFILWSAALPDHAYSGEALRLQVGADDDTNVRMLEAMGRLKKVISLIGNRSGPLTYYNIRPFELKDFTNSVEKSKVFKKVYSMDWGRFIEDLENNPQSEAYDYLIKFLKPKNKTYIYRIPEQHRFISKMVSGLLAQKIKARKGAEPVYVRLVTLGGGYDPVSIGATLMESIERELKNKYPGLVFGRDVILEIQDVQLDPKAEKEIKEIKEFTLEHTLYEAYNAPEEVKLHIKAINKNRARLMDIIKFRQGSIGDVRDNGLMADVLKDQPDLVVCNLAFYHLDIPHQKECIDFLGRAASEDTTFMFAFEVHLLTHAADRYVEEFGGDRKIASQIKPVSTQKRAYPPLFEKYFSIRRVPVGAIGSAFYVMRKKGQEKGQEVEEGLIKFAKEFQPIMDKIVEVTTEKSGFTVDSEKVIVNDYPYGCVTSGFATRYVIEKLYGDRLTVQLVEVLHPEMKRLNVGRHVANIIVDNLTGRKYFMSFFEGIWDDSYPGERTREIRSFLHFTQMRFDNTPTPAYAEWFKEQEFPPVFFEFREFKDITEATRLVVLGGYAEKAPEAETTRIFNYIDAIINFDEWRARLDLDTDRPVPVPSRASRSST